MPFTSSLGGGSTRSWGGIGAAGGGISGPSFIVGDLTYAAGLYETPWSTVLGANYMNGFTFGNNGTRFFLHGIQTTVVVGGIPQPVYRRHNYDLSTPYDLTTATSTSNAQEFSTGDAGFAGSVTDWRPDGLMTYNLQVSNQVYGFPAASAWEIPGGSGGATKYAIGSSSVYAGSLGYNLFNNVYNVSGGTIYYSLAALHFFDNGYKVIVCGNRHGHHSDRKGDTVAVWSLSTAYDLGTASLDSSKDAASASGLDHTINSGGTFYGGKFMNDGQTLVVNLRVSDTNNILYTFNIAGRNPNNLKFVSKKDFNQNDATWSPGTGFNNFVHNANIQINPNGSSLFHQAFHISSNPADRTIRRWDFID